MKLRGRHGMKLMGSRRGCRFQTKVDRVEGCRNLGREGVRHDVRGCGGTMMCGRLCVL